MTPFPEVTEETWREFLALQGLRQTRKRQRKLRRVLESFFAFRADHPDQALCPLLNLYQDRLRDRSPTALLIGTWVLRTWLRFLFRTGHLLEPAHDQLLYPPSRRNPRRALTYGQVAQLMKLPLLSDPLGLRDRALLETAYGSALRPSEVGRLLLADIRLAEGELVVRTPKNRLERIVPLTTAASVFLHRYLQDVRPLWLSPLTHGALWLNPSGHPLPISSFTRKRLRHTHRAPELLGTPFTLHHLRHSCATHLLQNGADLMAIRALLGHVSLESTSYYTFWTALELKKIQHRCHPRGK